MMKFWVSDLYAIDLDFINAQLDSLNPSKKEDIDYINQCKKTISDYLESDSRDILNKGSNSEYSTVYLNDQLYSLDKFIFLGLQLAFVPIHKVIFYLDFYFKEFKTQAIFLSMAEMFSLNVMEHLNKISLCEKQMMIVSEFLVSKRDILLAYESSKSDEDNRFDCNESIEYIHNYFKILTIKKGYDGINPIMTNEQLDQLLCSSFKGFYPIRKTQKMHININVEKRLTYFFYEFFNNKISNNRKGQKANFIKILFDNFSIYSDKDCTVFSSNWSI
jgi:hypothetical protein